MESVIKLLAILNNLDASRIWIGTAILTCLSLIYFAKQLQDLRTGSLSVKERQFEHLSKLLQEKDFLNKPGLLLEQAFENYFGFILGTDEIRHLLKSKKQTEAIRDLKYCRAMFEFKNDKFTYTRKISIKTRRIAVNITYWVSALMTIFTIVYALTPNNWPMFIYSFIFGFNAYLSLHSSRALSSAKRIESCYYGPNV